MYSARSVLIARNTIKRASTLAVLAFLAIELFQSKAAETQSEPFLQIEAGNHLEIVWHMVTDARRRWLATSDMKTVRIWNAQSGERLRVIRPPSISGEPVFAPNGDTFVIPTEENYMVFERASGRLLRTLKPQFAGETCSPECSAFSSDGTILYTASTGSGVVLQAWQTGDWKSFRSARVADLPVYSFATLGLSVSQNGSIVLSSKEEKIFLLDPSFEIKSKSSIEGTILRVNFSDNGQVVIADVFKTGKGGAYSPTSEILLLSAVDLSKIKSIDSRWPGGAARHVSRLLKNRIYHGGSRNTYSWQIEGPDNAVELGVGSDQCLPVAEDLWWLGNYNDQMGSLALINPNAPQTPRILHQSPTREVSFWADNKLWISADGDAVWISTSQGKDKPRTLGTQFNLRSRSISALDAPPPPNFFATFTGDASFTGMSNALKKNFDELVGVDKIAVAGRNRSFVVKATGGLKGFDPSGKLLWQQSEKNISDHALNLTPNGEVLITASYKRLITWHSMKTGKELLRLFLHSDGKRWIVWTPEGYYDCAPGAEDLIGWQIDNGPEAASDFFPASRFRSTKYRPDVIQRVLATIDTKEALRLADEAAGRTSPPALTSAAEVRQKLPPIVTILSPADGSSFDTSDQTLRYSVRTPSGHAATSVRLLIDGQPVETTRGLRIEAATQHGEEKQFRLKLPERDCELAVIAENENAPSEPARARYKWAGKPPVTGEAALKPKLYALVAGVSKYAIRGLYREVVTRLLIDQDATRDNLVDGLEWLEKQTTSRDIGVLFLAGHGLSDNNQNYYFLPHSADLEKLRRTCVSFADLQMTLRNVNGKKLFFVDTCHSGGVMSRLLEGGARRGASEADVNRLVNELSSAENGVVVFYSTTRRPNSLENPRWGNGAFTKAVVEGLAGKADMTQRGKVTVNSLDLYIAERVKELTDGQQTPVTTKPDTVPDFPIAIIK
jgi:hypothetical protein